MSLLSSFPDELVYGPLPVIGFVGSPELHAPLSKLLNGVLGDEAPPEGARLASAALPCALMVVCAIYREQLPHPESGSGSGGPRSMANPQQGAAACCGTVRLLPELITRIAVHLCIQAHAVSGRRSRASSSALGSPSMRRSFPPCSRHSWTSTTIPTGVRRSRPSLSAFASSGLSFTCVAGRVRLSTCPPCVRGMGMLGTCTGLRVCARACALVCQGGWAT